MIKEWLRKMSAASSESSARNAAEGTYETIRRAIIYAQPVSAADIEERILDRLATRRSWRRVDERSFVVRWGKNEATLFVERPLIATKFFLGVTEAEIKVFCAGVDSETMARLQRIGREELRRLFLRDGLPWTDPEST